MKTSILTGPVSARPHFDPFASRFFGPGSIIRLPGVFFETPERTKDPGAMSEGEFRGAVLGGVAEVKAKMEDTINNHKELKAEAEKTFKVVEKHGTDLATMGQKLADLEKASLAAQSGARRGLPPYERIREHEDTLAKIGEAVKVKGHFVLRAEGEDTSASGGNLVNPGLASDVYALELEYGSAKLLDYRTLSTKTEKMLVETAEPDAVFVAENGEIPEQGLNLGQVPVTARKIAAILGVSLELLDDSVIDLGAYVMRKFARANARRVDYVAFNGNGTSDTGGQNGGYTGLFNFGVAVAAAATHTTVEKLNYLDFLLCLTTVDPAVLQIPGACWMMHPTIVARALAVRDDNGRPIFMNALDAPANGAIGSILGYPVRMVSTAPNVNTAGLPVAAFGDPEAYTVGNRKEYAFDYSDHARFTSAQRVYRGISRKGFAGRRATAIAVLTLAAQ